MYRGIRAYFANLLSLYQSCNGSLFVKTYFILHHLLVILPISVGSILFILLVTHPVFVEVLYHIKDGLVNPIPFQSFFQHIKEDTDKVLFLVVIRKCVS